jgi:hypothetical protein
VIGDVFSTHCVDNPDLDSELQLLRRYGPDVERSTLEKLALAFRDLREKVEDGGLNYPYSTRELVSVVKHIQAFPHDGTSRALRNIFDFDVYTPDTRDLIAGIFSKRGIPMGNPENGFSVKLGQVIPLPQKLVIQTWERGNGIECHTESIGIVVKVDKVKYLIYSRTDGNLKRLRQSIWTALISAESSFPS